MSIPNEAREDLGAMPLSSRAFRLSGGDWRSRSGRGEIADVTDVVVCQLCGVGLAESGDPLLSWVMDRRDGRTSWTCPRCASSNLRALEAKLEPEWW
ncbi:MAG: hypothetical protein M3Y42_16005 [Actinomycetota bacterium]|nr:hypothetical protein [Actinomycetota bacterium]MDQ2958451.1 hypothetical protein [Actinomycetota bacterium]